MPFAWLSPSICPVRRAIDRVTGLNGQGHQQFVYELLTLSFSLLGIGAGRTVGQFNQRDDGNGDLGVASFA